MIDSITHFFEKFLGPLLLSILFLIVLGVYVGYTLPFLERLLDLFAGGILSTIIGTAIKRTNINADNVQTDAVNTNSIPDATINTDTVNLKDSSIKE